MLGTDFFGEGVFDQTQWTYVRFINRTIISIRFRVTVRWRSFFCVEKQCQGVSDGVQKAQDQSIFGVPTFGNLMFVQRGRADIMYSIGHFIRKKYALMANLGVDISIIVGWAPALVRAYWLLATGAALVAVADLPYLSRFRYDISDFIFVENLSFNVVN